MSEQTAEPTAVDVEADAPQTVDPKAPAKPQTLEDLLADLDDDRRKVILDQVNKPRLEAKGLRDRLKAAEPKLAAYARLEQESKTEAERAQEALTEATTRAAAVQQRWARAEVKAALAGVVDDPESIVDDLNLARFVDDDGEIDTAAVAALRARYAGFSGRRAPRPDASQASGANGTTSSTPADEFGSILQSAIRRTARG